ncbi:MAG TPA: queuosine salvage family protein, partial [Ktedonobacterales bacterium]|nr:queuosine salvage family protein [Ktedonobacterales bacterium]
SCLGGGELPERMTCDRPAQRQRTLGKRQPMTDSAFDPPREDRLGVLTSTARVMRQAQRVQVDAGAVRRLAERWAGAPWPGQAGLDAPQFRDGAEHTANWVLVLDALNFCFWGEPGGQRWRVEWRGETLDGYAALAAALTRAVAEGRPIWDAAYLAALDAEALAAILRPVAGSPEIPHFAERLANVREVGRVLLQRYESRFTRAIEQAGGSAVELALLLARDFTSFDDVARWHGQPARFYKRAQICVADLHAAFAGATWGAFADIERLTAFADYKLPQLLRQQGALVYAPELAEQVDTYTPLRAGSEAEVEIRAATVWGVEWLRRALEDLGIQRPASAIDYRLWAESQTPSASMRPYHRTRTSYY